ncbi:hypothetical protein [Limnobacter sp.]|uniref:hypothetical protein n=1 Tax=Limnobacter sp. TaxID=2003368 RepID=UPI003002C026
MTRTISKSQVIDALNEAFNICELLQKKYLSYEELDRSDANLLHIVTTYFQKNITVTEHHHVWSEGPILAFSLQYDDRFEICLLADLNYCRRKLALCKELFHLILSNPESISVEFDETIEKCASGGALDDIASSEYVAEIAAMEYLFPYSHRLEICKKPYVLDDIALRYRLPKITVEQYLTKSKMDALLGCYKLSSFGKLL